ncbi:hypothetical protein [Desulfoplanes sp.]
MVARFAHPRGVLADLLDMDPQKIPERWLRDKEVFALVTEYYSPSLEVLRGLEEPDPTVIPQLDAVGTTRDKDEYATRVAARIAVLEKKKQGRKKGFFSVLHGWLHR